MSDAAEGHATDSRLTGPVRVVGTGLLGTSVGLGLRARGVDVILADASPAQLALAVDYGAGRPSRSSGTPAPDDLPEPGDTPELIVVCVPPDVTARTVAAELAAYPNAIVTDVASVKVAPLEELLALGADVSRYLGSHPLAGRERGGAVSGRADLFLGRPWVIAGHDGISYRGGALVDDLVLDLGGVPIEMTAEQHDRSVALISHVPQLVATLMASRLVDAPDAALGLAGQGLRDVTRVAASDPELWVQILGSNAGAVRDILRGLATDLDAVLHSLDDLQTPGARRALAEQLAAGNAGVARIPGKHGQDRRFASVTVMVGDTPGQLARLLTEIGEIGVNLEDLRLEHSPGAQIGLAEIAVLPEAKHRLTEELASRGWRIAG